MMTIMDRSISYQINGLEKPQKISGFLKEKGIPGRILWICAKMNRQSA